MAVQERPGHYCCGASVIELLMTIVIFSLLAAIAMPRLAQLKASFVRHNGKTQFEYALRRAQQEAVKEGVRTVTAVSADGGAYSLGFDYPPYNNPLAEDAVSIIRNFSDEISVQLSADVAFDSQGNLIDATGEPTQLTVSLSYLNAVYCNGVINASGYTTFVCSKYGDES